MAGRWTLWEVAAPPTHQDVCLLEDPTHSRHLVVLGANGTLPWCDVLLGDPPTCYCAVLPFAQTQFERDLCGEFSNFSTTFCDHTGTFTFLECTLDHAMPPGTQCSGYWFWYDRTVLVARHITGIELRAHSDSTVFWHHPDGRSWTVLVLGSPP